MTPQMPACYMLFRKNDEMLFVLRENTGYKDGEYSLPAGRVEEGETFSQGALREAQEEVGLTLDSQNVKQIYTQHRKSVDNGTVWVDVFFEVAKWDGEPINGVPNEHSQIDWLDVNNLPANIMDYQKFALEQILAGKTYGEFGWDSQTSNSKISGV
jgi:8-oxo-dGTP diphosphatase